MANKLVEIVAKQEAKYGDREAYRFCWRKDGEWISSSWRELAAQVRVAARALAALNLIEKDTIAICSPNTPQILVTELGAFANRVASVPVYSASSQAQFDFIVGDSGAKVLFVGDSRQYPLAYSYWKRHGGIRRIVIFKNDGLELASDDTASIFWDDFVRLGMEASPDVVSEVGRRSADGRPDDMATLIYTSGTTGEPKGVVITHANYNAAIDAHLEVLTMVSDRDLSMAFLPMSHILEKAWCFFCIVKGIPIAVNYDPRVIQETIHQVHPTVMCCVPRFWEKVYAAAREKIAAMSWLERMMVRRALYTGHRRNLDYLRNGVRPPRLLEKEYRFWNRRVFAKLKSAIGIPAANMFPTAGAPLSDRICAFMRSVGIDVTIGYGLSETTATVSFFRQRGYRIGTAGVPLPSVDVRIDPANSEIQVKGATVTPGYYNNAAANAAAFTADGYFRTGDAGYIDAQGAIVLTERVKDLFKTSNGKYIAPQMIESRLAENKYIDESAVIGDRRNYVTALIVPNVPQMRRWAAASGRGDWTTERLCADPACIGFMMKQVESVQGDVAAFEKIRKITLLPNPFSVMNGEVTNTMKVRRNIVAERYAREIEAMYSD